MTAGGKTMKATLIITAFILIGGYAGFAGAMQAFA